MWKIISLQWCVGLFFCLLLLTYSVQHAISALWGFLAVVLPSTALAARVALGTRTEVGGLMLLMSGEILKIFATVFILYMANSLYPDLVWWPLVGAVVLTLKSYLLMFFSR